ncbi:MAG TPA: FG-GAP-like repeat-containing protein [Rubricoccaceae bacterium]|nr:FG-GAP-like repeat-containing protein [Rubricoccaceae bacterium]
MLRSRYALSFAVLVLVAGPTSAQRAFDAPWMGYNAGDSDTGRYTVRLLAEDFDNDGDPDLAVGRAIWNTGFSYLENRGDGTYAPPVFYTTNGPTWGMAAADFDADGDRDLVTTEFDPQNVPGSTVALFRNLGNDTFAPAQHFQAGQGPVGLETADFNGDSRPDLVVTNYKYLGTGNTASILLNDGAGGFAAPVPYAAGAAPWRVSTGDLDNDGDHDLAVANDNFEVNLLFNNGAGQFSAPVAYGMGMPNWASPFYPDAVLTDVDRDNDLDVAYTNTRTWDGDRGWIMVLRNDGNGHLAAATHYETIPYSAGPADLHAGDLNGDGWPDFAGAHYNGRTNDGIVVLLSNGSGGFGPATAYWAGQYTTAIDAADVDLDGDTDLVSVDWHSMEATVHKNTGNGLFPQAPHYEAVSGSIYVDLGDVDHDGDLDAFTSGGGASGTNPVFHRNDGTGAFAQVSTHGVGAYGKLRDLNGDGDLDLLYASAPTASAYDFFVAFGNGDGTFGAVTRWILNACGTGQVDAVDFDADGDLDVAMSEYGGCAGDPGSYRRLFVRLNNGDGTFQPAYTVLTDEYGPFPWKAGDFNHDGHVDLAVGHKGAYGANNKIVVLFGDGTGQFGQRQVFESGFGPHGLVVADLNADGWLDVATGNTGADGEGQETMTVLLNAGNGSFQAPVTQYAPRSADLLGVTGIVAGDPDADGDLDLMVSNYGANDIAFYENDGQGTFTFPYRYGMGAGAFDVHYDDVTGDDVPDLVGMIGLRPAGFPSAIAVVRGLTGTPTAGDPVPGPTTPMGGAAISSIAPNPAQGRTTLTFTLDHAQAVRVEVIDALGRRVAVIHDSDLPPGRHTINLNTETLTAGAYLVRLTAGGRVHARMLTVVQ